MTEITNMDLELDPYLKRVLTSYGSIPARNEESARRTREKFLTEISSVLLEATMPRSRIPRSWLAAAWRSNLARLKELGIFAPGNRALIGVLATVLIVVLLFFSGTGVTAYAAASSLPGDAIYPLKTMVENARVNLTIDPGSQARLYVDYAGRRLSEIQSLMEEGRYSEIAPAAEEFERDILLALRAVERLSQSDPARAASLNIEIAAILHNYTEILLQILAGLPADVQPAIQHALNTSESIVGDDDDEDDDGGGHSTPAPTATPMPESSLTSTTSTPAVTPTLGVTQPAPLPGGDDGGGGDDDDDDDDDGDDDDNDGSDGDD